MVTRDQSGGGLNGKKKKASFWFPCGGAKRVGNGENRLIMWGGGVERGGQEKWIARGNPT